MTGIMGVISYGLGTVIGFALIGMLVFWFIQDITQKKHSVLRNYPVIGRLRYFFEQLGEYFRQYFFAGDRDEQPFNRATRSWIYRLAKNEGGGIGFGSTYDIEQPGVLGRQARHRPLDDSVKRFRRHSVMRPGHA